MNAQLSIPEELGLIAGKGVYPLLLAGSAHAQGVRRVFAIAFKGETDRAIKAQADEVAWIRLGDLQRMLDTLRASGVRHAVMAGLITPTSLFRVRPDRRMLDLLAGLSHRNADTIFGAVANEVRALGIEVMPAWRFMERSIPAPGLLTRRAPSAEQQQDIRLGLAVAKATSGMDVGQTVVVKAGTILAVEAFEGTNDTIRRAARLGGPGIVVVKVAKRGHDSRFDIPVVGMTTIRLLKKTKAAVLALEAGRTLMLERERLVEEANAWNLCLTAEDSGDERFA